MLADVPVTGWRPATEGRWQARLPGARTRQLWVNGVRAVRAGGPPPPLVRTPTGFATAGRALNLGLLPEVIICLGSVPLAEYGLPGTPALTEGMLPYIPKYDALLMANHGVVSYGEDAFQAFFRMEMVEHFARITLVAELLGGPKVLARGEIQKLFDARARYHVTSRNRFEHPNVPNNKLRPIQRHLPALPARYARLLANIRHHSRKLVHLLIALLTTSPSASISRLLPTQNGVR